MQSKATTVAQYLKELPADRREIIESVRKLILKNLNKGFEEGMLYGMIGYYVPHKLYPPGYHCDPTKPLGYVCLASQKNYVSLYLNTVYGGDEDWFRAEWSKTGKKLNMGKCCVRFNKLEDLAVDVVGRCIANYSVPQYIEMYERLLRRTAQEKTVRAASRQAVPKSKRSPHRKPSRATVQAGSGRKKSTK